MNDLTLAVCRGIMKIGYAKHLRYFRDGDRWYSYEYYNQLERVIYVDEYTQDDQHPVRHYMLELLHDNKIEIRVDNSFTFLLVDLYLYELIDYVVKQGYNDASDELVANILTCVKERLRKITERIYRLRECEYSIVVGYDEEIDAEYIEVLIDNGRLVIRGINEVHPISIKLDGDEVRFNSDLILTILAVLKELTYTKHYQDYADSSVRVLLSELKRVAGGWK